MGATRFEKYVEERIAELASARRGRIETALKEAEAKVTAQRERYVGEIEEGVKALVKKTVEKAKKAGCRVSEDAGNAEGRLSDWVKDKVRTLVGLSQTFDYDTRTSRWPEGTPLRKLQDELLAFDDLCAREARKIVVYKKDLNMKPEAFEAMLAEVAEKLK